MNLEKRARLSGALFAFGFQAARASGKES